MRTIAYKQANHIKSRIKDSLPDDFITEWTYVDVQPQDSLKKEDGWQFLNEDEFTKLKDESNTDDNLSLFQQQMSENNKTIRMSYEEQDQQLIAEFEAFKKWKASQ